MVQFVGLNDVVPAGSGIFAVVLTVDIAIDSDAVTLFIPDIKYGGFCLRVPGVYAGVIFPAIIVILLIRCLFVGGETRQGEIGGEQSQDKEYFFHFSVCLLYTVGTSVFVV